VSGRVTFLGSFPRIEALLAICDLFVLPSVQESFGLAALEAMASGVPVIASYIGGIPEVVEHGVSGLLTAPDDTSGMIHNALRLLQDNELRRSFAHAARQRAETAFSEQIVLPQYRQAYETALERRLVSSGK
jgi:glycosyltransferase involved in cell wall biosynthesis